MSAFNAVEQYRYSAKAIIIIFELGYNLRFNDMIKKIQINHAKPKKMMKKDHKSLTYIVEYSFSLSYLPCKGFFCWINLRVHVVVRQPIDDPFVRYFKSWRTHIWYFKSNILLNYITEKNNNPCPQPFYLRCEP
ncbi:hypothetical protein HUJ05_011918 [Dendroctonus ponderosae]|nr:hypothetical protein HUJ05_011918 [Dendroctonus ponderosae]